MEVDLILEPGIASNIDAWQIVELDRRSVRVDQPGPDEQHPFLAEVDTAVIGTKETGCLD